MLIPHLCPEFALVFSCSGCSHIIHSTVWILFLDIASNNLSMVDAMMSKEISNREYATRICYLCSGPKLSNFRSILDKAIEQLHHSPAINKMTSNKWNEDFKTDKIYRNCTRQRCKNCQIFQCNLDEQTILTMLEYRHTF